MRRVDIANRFALAAREAERSGKHRRAAELYAEALRALLDKSSMSARPMHAEQDPRGGPGSEGGDEPRAERSAGERAATPQAEEREAPSERANMAPKETLIRARVNARDLAAAARAAAGDDAGEEEALPRSDRRLSGAKRP